MVFGYIFSVVYFRGIISFYTACFLTGCTKDNKIIKKQQGAPCCSLCNLDYLSLEAIFTDHKSGQN